jgi:hypothetical protein
MLLLLFVALSVCQMKSGPGFSFFCTGNCSNFEPRAKTQSQTGVVLMGGGTDVDDAFVFLVQRAGGASSNILILRAGPPGESVCLFVAPCSK